MMKSEVLKLENWMIIGLVVISFIAFFAFIYTVTGEQTVKTVEVPIGYVAQTTADTDYIQTITINPPDGIEEIHSFELIITGDFQDSTDIKARVRKTGTAPIFDCIPLIWATPNVNTPNYEASFDCSSLVDNFDFTTGQIDVGFRTSKVAQNVKGDLKMTYYNDPKPKIDIFTGATTYRAGKNATVFAKVTEYGEAVTDAFCDGMVFDSNQTEVEGFQLTYVPSSRGIYSYTFPVPNETGIYMVDIECYRPINETWQSHYFYGEGMPAYDLGFKNQAGEGQTYLLMEDVQESLECYPDRFSVSFNDFETGEFDEYRFLHGVHNQSVFVKKAVGVEKEFEIVLWYYKETEKGELTLGAAVNHSMIGTDIIEITFPDTEFNEPFDAMSLLEVAFCVKTAHDIGNDLTFYFNSTNESSMFDVHGLAVNFTVDFIVGGSSEIHVIDWFVNITAIAESSFDEAKFVGATEYDTGEEGKLMVQYIKTVAGAPSPENAANCTANVTYPNGTLYLTNYQLDYLTGSNGIYEKAFTVPSVIGVYTADYYCLKAPKNIYGSATFHVSYPINTTSISESVWSYPTRNLTYYPATDYNQIAEWVWNYSDRQVNLTLVIDEIQSVNTSIQVKLDLVQQSINNLNNLSASEAADAVWSHPNRTNITIVIEYLEGMNTTLTTYYNELLNVINNLENLTAYDVWIGFNNRTLTYYPEVDYSYIQALIWNNTDRNLTYFPTQQDLTDYDYMQLMVWNATTRTLTDYNQTEMFEYLLWINTTTWDTNYWVKQNNDILVNLSIGNITVSATINVSEIEEAVWNKTSYYKLRHDVLSFADGETQSVVTTLFCVDNVTLMEQTNVTRCILGSCWDEDIENPIICDYGCFENKCRPDPTWTSLWLLIIIIALGAGIYAIAKVM